MTDTRKGQKPIDSSPAALGRMAAQAAEEHTAHRAAIAAERRLECALLADVLAQVKVGLPAVSSWIPVHSGAHGSSWPKQGVLVAGTTARELPPLLEPEGKMGGKGLFLLEDGTFACATYHGEWARSGQLGGTTHDWVAEISPQTIEEVMDAWKLSDVLDGVRKAFAAQLGKRAKATREAEERAEKLAALVKLV